MSKIVIDVRGLACPEPLLAFTGAAKDADAAEMEISFDCVAARDNITRSAGAMGWEVSSVQENPEYTVMHLKKIV